jgi:transposase
MIQVTPQMRVLVAVEPIDFRKGIDGIVAVCKYVFQEDPFSGKMFVFRNKRKTAIKILIYDGQGFWVCQKRLSEGKFQYWPKGEEGLTPLAAHEISVLLRAGDPKSVIAASDWRKV